MTRLGGLRLVALIVAAVLGLAGGGVTAWMSPDDTVADPREFVDPLELGVPLENVGCTGQTLIMVGWGKLRAALSPSVADWPGVKYLDTSDPATCDTAYPEERGRTPRYVAYLPAFDSPEAACQERMTARHKGNFVSKMREDNEVEVQCACELEIAVLPAIGEGQELTAESGSWIYLYQGMLNDIGADPPVARTGLFGTATADATRTLQTDAALNPSGIVDADTWDVLRGKACKRYDY